MKLSVALKIIALVGMSVANGVSAKAHDRFHLRSLQHATSKNYTNHSGSNSTDESESLDMSNDEWNCTRNNNKGGSNCTEDSVESNDMSYDDCSDGSCDEDDHRVYDGTGPNGTSLMQQTGRYWKQMMKKRLGHNGQQSSNNNLRHLQQKQVDTESKDTVSSDRDQMSQDHLHSLCSDDPQNRDRDEDKDCNDQGPNLHSSARGNNCTGLGDCDDSGDDIDCDPRDGDCDDNEPDSLDGNQQAARRNLYSLNIHISIDWQQLKERVWLRLSR